MPKETIGEYLKRERELRQISLEEVSQGTKISINRLKAIEMDRLDELPAEIFVRGFIKSYAEFIGLVPEDVLLRYQEDMSQGDQEVEDLDLAGKATVWQHKKIVLILLLILAVIVGMIFWYYHHERIARKDSKVSRAVSGNVTVILPEKAPLSASKEVGASQPHVGKTHQAPNNSQQVKVQDRGSPVSPGSQ